MGTQQILMIILSVIVVGAAIAVGIQMFDTQADNQTRNALVVESMQMGVQAQAFYRTPSMMGGAGFKQTGILGTDTVLTRLALYINKYADPITADGFTINIDSLGEFVFTLNGVELEIVATDGGGKIQVHTLVKLAGGGKDGIVVNPNYTPATP